MGRSIILHQNEVGAEDGDQAHRGAKESLSLYSSYLMQSTRVGPHQYQQVGCSLLQVSRPLVGSTQVRLLPPPVGRPQSGSRQVGQILLQVGRAPVVSRQVRRAPPSTGQDASSLQVQLPPSRQGAASLQVGQTAPPPSGQGAAGLQVGSGRDEIHCSRRGTKVGVPKQMLGTANAKVPSRL